MSRDRQLVLTPLLDAPAVSAGILSAGAAHVALCAAGLDGWPCPIYQVTGWPCPGCGLGRACVLLLRGDWRESMRTHAYAPILLLTLGLLAVGLVLRGRPRVALCRVVHWLESRMMLAAILLPGLVGYWLWRLALDAPQWRLLVHS